MSAASTPEGCGCSHGGCIVHTGIRGGPFVVVVDMFLVTVAGAVVTAVV